MRSFVEINLTLEGKWLWQFMKENDTLWRKLIEANFGTADRGWYSRKLLKTFQTAWEEDVEKKYAWEGINFRMDSWLRGGVLRDQFPKIVAIVQHKNISAYESLRDIDGQREWHMEVVRNLND